MAIDLAKVKMAELKAAIKELNASKLLTQKIKMVGKAAELAQVFVDGLAECDKAGKLDEVPDSVFSYYNTIVPPKGAAAANTADATPDTTPAPSTRSMGDSQPTRPTSGRGASKPRATRASVFANIVKRGKFTKEQLAEKLDKEFRLNTKENTWWVGNYLNLLIELGAATMDEKGRVTYGT